MSDHQVILKSNDACSSLVPMLEPPKALLDEYNKLLHDKSTKVRDIGVSTKELIGSDGRDIIGSYDGFLNNPKSNLIRISTADQDDDYSRNQRTESSWRVAEPKGSLRVSARMDSTGNAINEDIAINDTSGNALSRTYYTFNNDGTVSECASSTKNRINDPISSNKDLDIIWTQKTWEK